MPAPSQFELSGAVTIRRLAQRKLPRLMENRLGLELLPITKVNANVITYERLGVFRGLMASRHVSGPAGRTRLPGGESWSAPPGYYATTTVIGEQDMINRRELGSWTDWDGDAKQTGLASDQITQQMLDRMEKNVFDLLFTGGYVVRDQAGTETQRTIYPVQEFTPVTAFSNRASSTPLAYLRDTIATLEAQGNSVDYRGGTLLCNRATANELVNNQNPADIGGKRLANGATPNALQDVNSLLMANDLPTIQIYNEGYHPEVGGHELFLPNGKIALIGKRTDGEPIGESCVTRAGQNPNAAPDWFLFVRDFRQEVPCRVEVTGGFNGGPKLFYPEALARINAF
jgi:hypothetical protein